VPDLETIPILPALWINPGMIPILHSLGLIIPGQLGPIILKVNKNSKKFKKIQKKKKYKIPGDLLGSKGVFNSDHIMLGDTISNGNNKVKFGLNGIDDGIGGKGWGDIDDRGVTSSLFFSI
jgi:hypothetical protein